MKRTALSIVRDALARRGGFGMDASDEQKQKQKQPWTVEQTSDDEVTYKFKVHVNKKKVKPVSKELAEQTGVAGNGSEGKSEEDEEKGDRGGTGQDSAFWVVMDSPSAAVNAARRQCAATIEQCRARNKFACPYHGAQAVKADLIDRLMAAGVNSVPDVEAVLNNRGKPTGTYSISISCVNTPDQRRNMERVINEFLRSPGIDQQSTGEGAENDYDDEDEMYNSLFDVDALNPTATREEDAHEEREDEPQTEQRAEQPQQEERAEEPEQPEQPQSETPHDTPQETRSDTQAETEARTEPQQERPQEQTPEPEQAQGGEGRTYTVTGADGQPINVKMDWDIGEMDETFGFTIAAGTGYRGLPGADIGTIDTECAGINNMLGAEFNIRDATFRELSAANDALLRDDKRGFVDAIARHLKPLGTEGQAEQGQEQTQGGQQGGGMAQMHSALPGEHGSVRITASRAPEGEQSEIIGMDAEDSRNTILRVNNAIRSSGLGPVSNFVVDVHGMGRGEPTGMLAFPVALSVLAANGKIGGNEISDYTAVGSLGIDGQVVKTPAAAIRNMCLEARRIGSRGILVPEDQAGYLSDIEGIDIYPIRTLREAADFLNGDLQLQPMQLSRSRDMDARNATEYLRSIGYADASADNNGVSLGDGTRMSWEEYGRTPIMPTDRAARNYGGNAGTESATSEEPIGSLAEEFERAFPEEEERREESREGEPRETENRGGGAAATARASSAAPAQPAAAQQNAQPAQSEETPRQTNAPSRQTETQASTQAQTPSQPIPTTPFNDMAKEAFTRAKNAAFAAGADDRVAQARGRALSSVLGRANGIAGGHTMAEIHDRLHSMMGEAAMRNDSDSVKGYQQALDMIGNEGGFTPHPFDVNNVRAPEIDYNAIEHGDGDNISQSEIDAIKTGAKGANLDAFKVGHSDSSRSPEVARAHALAHFLSRNGGLQSPGGITLSQLKDRMRARLREKANDETAAEGTRDAIVTIGRILGRGGDAAGFGLLADVDNGNLGRQTQSATQQSQQSAQTRTEAQATRPQSQASPAPRPTAAETPAPQTRTQTPSAATATPTPQPALATPQPPTPQPRPAQPRQPQTQAQQPQARQQASATPRQGNNGFTGRRAQAAAQRLEEAARRAGSARVRSILERIRDNARRLGGQGQN